MSKSPVLNIQDVRFAYTKDQPLLHIADFKIAPGESVFLRGPSGSGKSTLLGLIGGVLNIQEGKISIVGNNLSELSAARRDQLRADHMGIIFQQFNLLPYLSVEQNCALPCRFSSKRRAKASEKYGSVSEAALSLANRLGLEKEALVRPVNELSVGQQQRVAVARALIGGPDLIIADEPTSALDHENRDRFVELLNTQRQSFGSSLLFVSHDQTLEPHFDRVVALADLNQLETA